MSFGPNLCIVYQQQDLQQPGLLLVMYLLVLHRMHHADCSNCVLQALRAKCLQLEDDVHMLNDKLKQAQDVVAEKDRYIDVRDVDF